MNSPIHYNFSESFTKWLAKNRPDTYRLFTEKGVRCAQMWVAVDEFCRPFRFRLEFPGILWTESDEFDRQVDAACATMVLEKHPDLFDTEAVTAPLSGGLWLDAEYVARVAKRSIKVPATVVAKEAYYAKLKLVDGSFIEIDIDELKVWQGIDEEAIIASYLAANNGVDPHDRNVYWPYNETFDHYRDAPLAGKRAHAFIEEANQQKGGHWVLHTKEQHAKWYAEKGRALEFLEEKNLKNPW